MLKVKTETGIIEFSKGELQDFFTNPELYRCADNLPKWLSLQIAQLHGISMEAASPKAYSILSLAIDGVIKELDVTIG